MSKQEVLEKAIKRAIDNGWNKKGYDEYVVTHTLNTFFHNNCDEHGPEDFTMYYSPTDIIYDHDFAKALWGEEHVINGVKVKSLLELAVPQAKDLKDGMDTVDSIFGLKSKPIWEYHLQQMVVADDPIEYLKDNLDKEGRE